MKISELFEQLQDIKTIEGDLEVYCYDEEYVNEPLDVVEVVTHTDKCTREETKIVLVWN